MEGRRQEGRKAGLEDDMGRGWVKYKMDLP